MFSWFKKKTPEPKIYINEELRYVIRNSKYGQEVKAIDSKLLALISVKKQNEGIAVSIEFERQLDGDIFTEIHKTVVDNEDAAIMFFSKMGICGQMSWIGDITKRYHKKVSLLKG